MVNNYEKETRTGLHKAETKINTIEANLRQDLCETRLELGEVKATVNLFRWFCRLLGGAIIVADIIKDYFSQKLHLRYAADFGWQQWVLIGLGIALIGVGIYRKPK